ncbi:hypothetical protein D3C76_753840 [compost metagenome]
MNAGILRRSSSIRATSAVSMAVSVPAAAMAKPISERARAGASLMPSPTMPTLCPLAYSASIACNLSLGNKSPLASSMPTWAAIAWAVWTLSPVSIRVLMPKSCSCWIASRLDSFTVSATANSANGPDGSSSNTTDLPCFSSANSCSSSSGEHRFSSSTSRWLPR